MIYSLKSYLFGRRQRRHFSTFLHILQTGVISFLTPKSSQKCRKTPKSEGSWYRNNFCLVYAHLNLFTLTSQIMSKLFTKMPQKAFFWSTKMSWKAGANVGHYRSGSPWSGSKFIESLKNRSLTCKNCYHRMINFYNKLTFIVVYNNLLFSLPQKSCQIVVTLLLSKA